MPSQKHGQRVSTHQIATVTGRTLVDDFGGKGDHFDTVQHDSPHFGELQVRATESGTRKNPVAQVRSTEVDLREICSLEVGAHQRCLAEAGSTGNDLAEVRIGQIGVVEARLFQASSSEIGVPQEGPIEARSRGLHLQELGTREIHPGEDRLP